MKQMFKDRLVIITGGSSGIGKVLAHRLFRKGANIALIARDEKKLNAVKEELIKAAGGQKVEAHSCDVADYQTVEATFAKIIKSMGLPYMLINSAGVLKEGYFEKQPLETFRTIMDINYFGTLHCIQAALPYFKQAGKGRIVNMSSMGGRIGSFGYSAYCSSKFAVNGLTETLRAELRPQKIRFHLVCPPEFDSPMVDELNTYRTIENRELVQTIPVLTVDTVADEIISGIENGKFLIIPGKVTRVIDGLNRLSPRLSRSIIDYRIKKVYRGPQS
jgi:3-dehydrosphinganine reductase